MRQREEGFTLVETLVTLMIISILILLPLLSINRVIHLIETEIFFRELNSNVTMIQSHAILTGKNTAVEFVPKKNIIRFKVFDQSYPSGHPLNQEIKLEESNLEFYGSKYQSIYFLGNTGNVSVTDNNWRVFFKNRDNLYEFVLKLGSGRFEVRKK